MKVRTRIAPSPTGSVHIGSIHNALFAHALAKHNGGDFILRVEDTDQERYVEGAAEEVYEILDIFGLAPDEGPVQGGPYAPYIQSKRVDSGVYEQTAEKLVQKGHAYYCFHTKEELEQMRESMDKRTAFRSKYRDMDPDEAKKKVEDKEEYVIRLKVPVGETITLDDAILGQVEWNSDDIDDQVLLKSDGFPTYHLAVVVDDNIMKISHITRSYEWLASTPKQVLLYKYLEFDQPIFAHSSLVLDPDGGKLSKRKGNVSAKSFLEQGYLPEAIKNFLMLLGWAPPIERKHGEKEREIFSHKEFIDMYELKDRQKTNAVFNRKKLIWFNQQYIKSYESSELLGIFKKWLEKFSQAPELLEEIQGDEKKYAKAIDLVKMRARTFKEVVEMLNFFYQRPEGIDWNIKQLEKAKGKIQQLKEDIIELMDGMDADTKTWTNDEWAEKMKSLSEKYGLKTGDSFMVLRVAVVGTPFSPPLFESLQILGKAEILKRLRQ